MLKSWKTSICIASVIFIITASVIAGCTQMGTGRTPDTDNMGMTTQQNNAYGGYGTNNLVGMKNRSGNTNGDVTNNTGTNLGGNRTGYNGTKLGNGNTVSQGNVTGNGSNQITTADRQKASNIKRQLLKIDGINAVDVVVVGDTALVGVKTNGTTTADIKNRIEKRIKEMDKTIKNVTVSDSPDILSRMRRLGTSTAGEAKNIMDEFRNLIDSATTGSKGR